MVGSRVERTRNNLCNPALILFGHISVSGQSKDSAGNIPSSPGILVFA